jgi:hypothetical protein
MVSQYQDLQNQHEMLALEIQKATEDLKKQQSIVAKQMETLRDEFKANLDPGMK